MRNLPPNPRVWFAPDQAATDIFNLFNSAFTWPIGSKRINVLKVSQGFVIGSSNYDLTRMLRFLRQNNIYFAMEFGPLIANGIICGNNGSYNVESYSGPVPATYFSTLIQSLGGTIDYIAFDEPLYFGHYYNGILACLSSIDVVANQTAQTVAMFQSFFPNIVFGDMEPFDFLGADWPTIYPQWAKAYQAHVGKPFSFIHYDPLWPFINATNRLVAPFVQSLNINYGILFDGIGYSYLNTDGSWMFQAEQNIQNYFTNYSFPVPDQIIIQSFNANPTLITPETSPLALAYLINYIYPYLGLSPATTSTVNQISSVHISSGYTNIVPLTFIVIIITIMC